MYRLQQMVTEWRQLARLGGPILIAQVAQMANSFIDTVMAGNASSYDLAGVGIGVSLWVPLLLFFVGVLGALQPIISQHMGAKEASGVMPVAWQGLYLAVVGSALMIVILMNTMPLVALFKPDETTRAIVEGYLAAFVWGVPALVLLTALRGFTDGMGATWVFMAFSLLGTLCNIPLNYALIYGKWGLPELGGVGCGWATSVSNMIALSAFCLYLLRGRAYAQYRLFSNRSPFNAALTRKILALGIPIGITLFVEVSMFCAIALFLAPLGAQTVAAHQIVLNATSMAFMIPLSLGMAVMLRVSYLVGEKAYDKARLVARSSILLSVAIAIINAPILFFGRDVIASFYTQEHTVLILASTLFMFAAIFQLVDVVQVTAVNALRGYKDTKLPMWIIVLSFWGVCLPLGYILTYTSWLTPQALGAKGYWIALTVGLAIAAILLTVRLFCYRYQPVMPHEQEMNK